MSRLWGYLNSLELPVWARPTGFRVYSYIFGCNLDEIEHSDLTKYKSLGDFFYRRLKEGARPIASAPLVSDIDLILFFDFHLRHTGFSRRRNNTAFRDSQGSTG